MPRAQRSRAGWSSEHRAASVAVVDRADELLIGLGAALREARQARRLAQEQLALTTVVHRNYIGGIERGERSPSVRTIITLAMALDVPISELFRNAEDAA
jgi:DNA-binding XRE family transcriptional regulator